MNKSNNHFSPILCSKEENSMFVLILKKFVFKLVVGFLWMKFKTTKFSKGAYKSTFGKNNIYEKVLPSLQSALCSIILANYLGIIKKFARKQFSCYLCVLYLSNKLIMYIFWKYDRFYSERTFTTLNHQRLKGFMNKSLNLSWES